MITFCQSCKKSSVCVLQMHSLNAHTRFTPLFFCWPTFLFSLVVAIHHLISTSVFDFSGLAVPLSLHGLCGKPATATRSVCRDPRSLVQPNAAAFSGFSLQILMILDLSSLQCLLDILLVETSKNWHCTVCMLFTKLLCTYFLPGDVILLLCVRGHSTFLKNWFLMKTLSVSFNPLWPCVWESERLMAVINQGHLSRCALEQKE